MDRLLRGIVWRYALLFVGFGALAIILVITQSSSGLYVNLLATLLLLCLIPFLFVMLMRKRLGKK